jgi:hypothetical protein
MQQPGKVVSRKRHARILGLSLAALLVWGPGMHPRVAEGAEEQALQAGALVDGLIVKWRTEQSGDALKARVASADSVARKRGIRLRYERSGALGIHVLKLDKARPAAQVEALAREIAANDPELEYAEADEIMQPM